MKPPRPHPHTLTGANALHALTGTEAARFERHLARCPACAEEIADFAETTARLAAAAATPPRPASSSGYWPPPHAPGSYPRPSEKMPTSPPAAPPPS
jgi:Putative zinc-finger